MEGPAGTSIKQDSDSVTPLWTSPSSHKIQSVIESNDQYNDYVTRCLPTMIYFLTPSIPKMSSGALPFTEINQFYPLLWNFPFKRQNMSK